MSWLAYIDYDPDADVPIPARAMPTPNAYSLILDASAAIPACDRMGPNGTNVSLVGHALKGAKGIVQDPSSNTSTSYKARMVGISGDKEGRINLQGKLTILGQYRNAINQVRKSFAYEFRMPPILSPQESVLQPPEYQQLGTVLKLDAQVKAEQGDVAGSVNSSLDAMELAVEISHGGLFGLKSYALSLEASARDGVWPLVDRLDARQVRAAARRMERIVRKHDTLADTLEDEKWVGLTRINELFRTRNWRLAYRTYMGTSSSSSLPKPLPDLYSYLELVHFNKRQIRKDYLRYADYVIEESRKSYVQARNLIHVDWMNAEDPVAANFVPYYADAKFRETAGRDAQDALLLASFALRAYEIEHHRLPPKLTALVPEYLASVPKDPFVPGNDLGYRAARTVLKDGKGVKRSYIDLYSIGPDCSDDEGIPIRNTTVENQNGKNVWDSIVRPKSTGDIVAGFNTN